MKQCVDCKDNKPLAEFRFYNRAPNSSFYSKQCRKCLALEKQRWVKANWDAVNKSNKAYNKKFAHIIRGNKLAKYWPGTDWEQATKNYNILLIAQNHVCALCGEKENRVHKETGTIWDLAVDHCHETGQVRGLLCNSCNRGLGLLGDTIDTLRRVLIYLEKHLEVKLDESA